MTLIVTVVICVVIALLGIYFQVRYTSRSVTQGPALLTMLGISGTFFGIALGLLRFDASDIQGSIPGLLGGIRISVWASFIGILFAIFLKVRYALAREDGADTEDKSDAEIIASQLQSLQRAISGDDESTVISQMKLARSDVNDRLDALKRSQAEFMEKLAEMSSKTLVEALRDVIRDFNVKITEQFGDNFKELNSAVGRLVDWQEQYRLQLDELIRIERESASTLNVAVEQHKAALSSSANLLRVAEGFKSILDAADAYKESLASNTALLIALIDEIREAVPDLSEKIAALIDKVAQSITRSEAEVTRIGAEISERFKAAASAIEQDLASSLATANRQVNDNLGKLVGSTKEQVEQLQLGLEETLNMSLNTLGQQLASLSSRFVEDYGPVADRLREIVNAGRGV